MIPLRAATLREIDKQDIASLTKPDKNMRLSLAQKVGKIPGRSSKQIRTALMEGLGSTYGFEMARKESNENWLVRVLYCMFYYDKPCQNQLGVMDFLEAHK